MDCTRIRSQWLRMADIEHTNREQRQHNNGNNNMKLTSTLALLLSGLALASKTTGTLAQENVKMVSHNVESSTVELTCVISLLFAHTYFPL